MKLIFFSLIFMLSLSAQAYYYGSGVDQEIQSIKRKQECLERQNREQREYTECLRRCQQRRDRQRDFDRSMERYSSFSIPTVVNCYCSQPSSLGCY